MWSLYNKTNDENSVNPFDTVGIELPPMEFTNGKTQALQPSMIIWPHKKSNTAIAPAYEGPMGDSHL